MKRLTFALTPLILLVFLLPCCKQEEEQEEGLYYLFIQPHEPGWRTLMLLQGDTVEIIYAFCPRFDEGSNRQKAVEILEEVIDLLQRNGRIERETFNIELVWLKTNFSSVEELRIFLDEAGIEFTLSPNAYPST